MPVDPRCVKELFNAALDLPQAADRAAFLDRECAGDRELRLRLDVLIAATMCRQASSNAPSRPNWRISVSASTLRETAAASEPLAGWRSNKKPAGGRFRTSLARSAASSQDVTRLRQEIGEGGMGSVYLAEQTHPVKRQVALKLDQAGHGFKPSWPGSNPSGRRWH